MVVRHILAWFMLLIVAVLNGIVRQTFFLDRLGELHAHQLSTLTGIVLFGIVIWILHRVWPLATPAQAWLVGCVWLVLTLAFELLFFHYVGGKSWELLLRDDNVAEGRLWPLLLIWVMVAPYLMHRIVGPIYQHK
jgi:hypothetical protein